MIRLRWGHSNIPMNLFCRVDPRLHPINCRAIRFHGDSPSVCFSRRRLSRLVFLLVIEKAAQEDLEDASSIHGLIAFHGTTSSRCVPGRIRLSHYFPLHCAITERLSRTNFVFIFLPRSSFPSTSDGDEKCEVR